MKYLIFVIFYTSSLFATTEKEVLLKIKTFGSNLKKELQAGLKKSPKEAIAICHIKAPELAQAASTEGVKIGRVSLKNRNPENSPKKWMQSYIADFHTKKIKKPYITTKLESGKTGLLKPIVTMPLCLKCHGSEIDAELYVEIKKLYPADKAIGYQVGEIRGFFWAEY